MPIRGREQPRNPSVLSTEGGSRTLTPFRTADFESAASAIPPLRHSYCAFAYLLVLVEVSCAAAFCRRERGGHLRNGGVGVNRALTQFSPAAHVPLVGPEPGVHSGASRRRLQAPWGTHTSPVPTCVPGPQLLRMATAMLLKFETHEFGTKLGMALATWNVPYSSVAELQSHDPSRPCQLHALPSTV